MASLGATCAIPAGAAGAAAGSTTRVGPNAVIRLAEALVAATDEWTARAVFEDARMERMFDAPPERMVAEADVRRLFDSLWLLLPDADADAVARDAGRRTADYLLAHRIPRPAQWLLRRLPPAWSARLLLRAVAANAWTFAGSGRFDWRAAGAGQFEVSISANPISMPGCTWHRAVFARLFTALVDPDTQVRHTACCRGRAPACRFDIRLPHGDPNRESPRS